MVRALADTFEPPTLDNQSKITHQLQCHSIAFVTQLIILYCILFCTLIMSNPNSPLHSPPGSPQPHQEQQQQPQQQDNIPPAWLTQLVDALRPPATTKLTSSLPPKYSANASQHATAFINSMEVYFALQESTGGKVITDKERILHTMLNTEGPVLLWVQSYISTFPNSNFVTFKASFLQRFTPANESSEALKFLQQHIHVLSRPDLKQAIDQYNELFLQKKQLVHGVQEQVFTLAYVSHLPRTLQGHVESKIREWQAANPLQVAAGNGQPPLINVMEYTTAAVPLCQSQWIANDRRYAIKKDSSSRVSGVSVTHGLVRDEDNTNQSIDVASSTLVNNAVGAYNSNGYNRGGYGNRYSSRGRGVGRQSTVPQWVLDYCRNNKLCYRCKEPFVADTHPLGRRCNRPFKRLDEKLRPQSN